LAFPQFKPGQRKSLEVFYFIYYFVQTSVLHIHSRG
jgi:hypothetical protein